MGKGKDGCGPKGKGRSTRRYDAASMGAEERREAVSSEVDEILRRLSIRGAAKRLRNRRREALNNDDLYNRMVDESLVLPREDERRLLIIAKTSPNQSEAKKARQALVLCNQRWIIRSAHHREWGGRGVSVEELMDAGNAGLLHAIDKFDIGRPNSFITYAKNWVHMYQQRLTERESDRIYGVRLPTDVYAMVGRVRKGLAISHEESAEDLSLEELTELCNSKRVSAGKPLTTDQVQQALDILRNRPISQQARLGSEDSHSEFGETLVADQPSAEDEVVNGERAQAIEAAFRELSPQEQVVMGSTLGYGPYEQLSSVQAIAERYDLKPAQVTRLRGSAYLKLQDVLSAAGFAPGS